MLSRATKNLAITFQNLTEIDLGMTILAKDNREIKNPSINPPTDFQLINSWLPLSIKMKLLHEDA